MYVRSSCWYNKIKLRSAISHASTGESAIAILLVGNRCRPCKYRGKGFQEDPGGGGTFPRKKIKI